MYWSIDTSRRGNGLGLVQRQGEFELVINIQFRGKEIPIIYEEFMKQAWTIRISDSNNLQQATIWLKKSENQFYGKPEIFKMEHLNNKKKAFVTGKNRISIEPRWIRNLAQLDAAQFGLENWTGYRAQYDDVTSARGLMLSGDEKGTVLMFFDSSGTQMREAYTGYGVWNYVRHVEEGLALPYNINFNKPFKVLSYFWKIWITDFEPYVSQLEAAKVSEFE